LARREVPYILTCEDRDEKRQIRNSRSDANQWGAISQIAFFAVEFWGPLVFFDGLARGNKLTLLESD
jgi:hypothetical protein